MRIELNRIQVGKFRIREKLDEEHLRDIMMSFEKDGQWDPIIVRPAKEKGYYELIAGEYRVEAARKLAADFLAFKTNIIRQSMTPLEEGRAIQRYIAEHNLTQKQVAQELGRSEMWVSERLALALSNMDDNRYPLPSKAQRETTRGIYGAIHQLLLNNHL